jgi:hypothetical protein
MLTRLDSRVTQQYRSQLLTATAMAIATVVACGVVPDAILAFWQSTPQ